MIVINFKTYPELTGPSAVEKAKICARVSQKTGVEIIIGVQAVDVYRISSVVDLPVFGQHLDPFEPGRNTGYILASSLKKASASGVFLNHSEHPLASFSQLKKSLQLAKKEGLKTLIFVKNLSTAVKIDRFKPDYIALEEPSLISKKAMVEFPRLIKRVRKFTRQIKSFPILGAGIKTEEDVRKSLDLGIKGVAFASQFAKTGDPYSLLLSFARCFQ